MSGTTLGKKFNLPWHQHDRYWVHLYATGGKFPPKVFDAAKELGFEPLLSQGMALATQRDWKTPWDALYAMLEKNNAVDAMECAVTPWSEVPPLSVNREPACAINEIAQSLWLGDALADNRVVCYLQPVMSTADKTFGYESFARVKALDNSIIGGDKIIAAARALGIEHMVDRHLQVQAIRTFLSSKFNGFLFVNFLPGFIHRPDVYLEGLGETVKAFGVVARNIVLDFTKAEDAHDILHLRNVCQYGRSCGYSIALDDVTSVKGARKLVSEIRPDFVKIDMGLVRRAGEPTKRDTIRDIVDLVHTSGGTVIAEGVENEEIHQALRQLGVDLFQGYLFSPPLPVEAALKRSNG